MPHRYLLLLLFCIALKEPFESNAMVYDNRFIPLYSRPRIAPDPTESFYSFDFMIATGNNAAHHDDRPLGVPEIYGFFNQTALSNALQNLGLPDPLLTEWQKQAIGWQLSGKVQMRGAVFEFLQKLGPLPLFIGGSACIMRIITRNQFTLNRESTSDINPTNLHLSLSDNLEIADRLNDMLSVAGLQGSQSSRLGVGDIDLYLRYGKRRDYIFKCRSINAGLRIGALIPTGKKRDITEPSSIPFGGNGHPGIYGAADALFELREDMKIGLYLRCNKRFATTTYQRLPVCNEPFIFGATTGPARVDPGVTLIFSPFLVGESLRKGFGLSLQYTLVEHWKDLWTDARCEPSVPVCLKPIEDRSSWGSDYVTVTVFYDTSKECVNRPWACLFTLRWDIPAHLLIERNIVRTHRVSLGFEIDF